MPEIQLDVQVANRFISSLSKSLQALCHGCMDFDNGIEIVGYINVNIDSGSKVDYVLNEKVLKSTTNSMTFVSNSFLAKKDQPKQTRDGSCSPVPELEEQYQAAFRGASMGMHRRSASHLPPQSHSFRGSSKRSWSGDLRMAAKRHRLQHPQAESQSFSGHLPQFPQPTFPSPSSQVYTDSSFKHPQPSHATELSSDSQQQISIKKEALDTDDNKLTSNPDTDSSTDQNQPPDESHDSEQADNFKIKQDPDAACTTDDQEASNENTDIKNTLQDQSSSGDNEQPEGLTDIKSTNEEVPDDQLPTFGEGQNVAAEQDGASTSADMGFPSEGGAFDSDIPIEYDNAAEDGSYSQSTFADSVDPGEGSSDANQFEVIEIDDEDEDVQAMFGEPREYAGMSRNQQDFGPSQWAEFQQERFYQSSGESITSRTTLHNVFSTPDHVNSIPPASSSSKCPFCTAVLTSRILYQKHMNMLHRQECALPYTCQICQMGFFSSAGLKHHGETHKGRKFVCAVCSFKFHHKHHLRRHLGSVHGVKECHSCMNIFRVGPDFNSHVLTCRGSTPCENS